MYLNEDDLRTLVRAQAKLIDLLSDLKIEAERKNLADRKALEITPERPYVRPTPPLEKEKKPEVVLNTYSLADPDTETDSTCLTMSPELLAAVPILPQSKPCKYCSKTFSSARERSEHQFWTHMQPCSLGLMDAMTQQQDMIRNLNDKVAVFDWSKTTCYFGLRQQLDEGFLECIVPEHKKCQLYALRGDSEFNYRVGVSIFITHPDITPGAFQTLKSKIVSNDSMRNVIFSLLCEKGKAHYSKYSVHTMGTVFEALFWHCVQLNEARADTIVSLLCKHHDV
jgi:hypothetical protein